MENDILDAPVKGLEINTNALSNLSEAEKEKLYQYAVNLMSTGFTNDQIRTKLIDRGNPPEVAEYSVTQLGIARTATAQINKAEKGNPTLDLVLGVVFLVAGLIGTFADTGRIFYGAIIFGIFRLVKGIIGLSNNN